jgi:uncharacterized protein (UPF0248 family)
MLPIHELLNRIRWDTEFAQARFEIGFYDRHEESVQRVSLQDISFPADKHHVFQLIDDSGVTHRIPFHRVRLVYRNGELIWHRANPRDQTSQIE